MSGIWSQQQATNPFLLLIPFRCSQAGGSILMACSHVSEDLLLCAYVVCVCVCACHGEHVKGRGQLHRVGSLHPPLYKNKCVCMGVLPECLLVPHIHVWCLQKPEEGIRTPVTGVPNGCEPPCGQGIQARSSSRAASLLNSPSLTSPSLQPSSSLSVFAH